jgi:hypothetical protein
MMGYRYVVAEIRLRIVDAFAERPLTGNPPPSSCSMKLRPMSGCSHSRAK